MVWQHQKIFAAIFCFNFNRCLRCMWHSSRMFVKVEFEDLICDSRKNAHHSDTLVTKWNSVLKTTEQGSWPVPFVCVILKTTIPSEFKRRCQIILELPRKLFSLGGDHLGNIYPVQRMIITTWSMHNLMLLKKCCNILKFKLFTTIQYRLLVTLHILNQTNYFINFENILWKTNIFLPP